MAKYTFLDLAVETLLATGKDMTNQAIWEESVKRGFTSKLRKIGQTPWDTLGARIYVDVRDNPNSPLIKRAGRPAAFALKDPVASHKAIEKLNQELAKQPTESDDTDQPEPVIAPVIPKEGKYPYKERDLHPWLVHFAKYELGGVFAKTVFHERSSKKNYGEWLHPDLVGFWFPFEGYTKEILEAAGGGFGVVRFYSFEMKREITMGNLRESFFQTVSNSTWAHEGYLAAPNIDESEDLRAELGRLSGSFGIGVIELDVEDPEQSRILFPARRKDRVDWEGANKLATENPDFRRFLTDVSIDISKYRAHPSEYDAQPTMDELASVRQNWGKKGERM